ncbi:MULTISPECIES: reverse transcriptase domain-containing protein [Hyphobacterium]|uniref:Reverse transcriptase domain-containing protein n=1 Tax=Hyphobacterium vulgare TaxID=1736751 RepID=A0ABV6ZWU6_9PROT
MSWAEYRKDLTNNLGRLAARLSAGTWRPSPAREVPIETFDGKKMILSIPIVEDRIVHRALRNLLEPTLERHAFFDFASGFRPKRNRITAVRQAAEIITAGFPYAADVDVESVSDDVTVDEVVTWVAQWISDGSVLTTYRHALEGLPTPLAPGSGLSPMLLNLRLLPIDATLQHERIVRFGDNFCVFTATRALAEAAFDRIVDTLQKNGLRPSMGKSSVRDNVNPEDLFLLGG